MNGRRILKIIPVFFAVWTGTVLSAAGQNLIGRSAGEMAFLEYSNGKVRLGADKAGYIDEGIRLHVIDSVKNRYKLQLARNWTAYIPKDFVKELKESTAEPEEFITGSWHLSGEDNRDVLSVEISERLPYRTFHSFHDNTIIIDVFGAKSNTTWITQLRSAKMVKKVHFEQVEDDVFRILIDLKGKQNWGYQLGYKGNRLVVNIRHAPSSKRIKNLKIAIDAGHGGSQPGAAGQLGTIEKEYTLKFAQELEKLLKRRGVRQVFMTRTQDIDLDMSERIPMLREEMPQVLVSLHFNSSGKPAIRGVSTYYKNTGNRPLAQELLDQMLRIKGTQEFGLIGNFNFTLNSPIEFPNALVEIAFISNPEDEALIRSKKFRKQTARKVFKGIKRWLRQAQK